jgi:arylsulfatase A-like enzyme
MALQWLDRAPEPFFLYVHTLDPHDPYEPEDEDWQPFRPEGYRGDTDPRRLVKKRKLDDEELRYLRSKYRAEVRQNDRAFGTLVDALRSRGLLDRSVVVFTSDHGEEFLEHGGLLHRATLYEEILRVPLAARLPNGEGGGRVSGKPFRQVDLFPTLAALLGAELPAGVEGADHSSAWRSPAAPVPPSEPTARILDKELRKFSVRSDELKLIVNADPRGYWRTHREVELYDVRADPGEQRNLVDERPIAVRYLQTRLELPPPGDEQHPRSGASQPLTAAEREHLRALGYVE